MKNNKKSIYFERSQKVFIGLSGGVDSAVSAALLKMRGCDVTGVFIKAWTPEGYPCTWKEDRRSAMRVAAVLDIPFITLNLEKEYKKEVVDYMIAEYKSGRTPNPDIMCNREIKFGHFLEFALRNGADFIATGHYARNPTSDVWFAQHPMLGYKLLEGKDKNKDQSYFLWTLTQKQLKHILFPIGHLQKLEVRRLAKKFDLPQAARKDSQGLCFLGKIDMKKFLSRYIPQNRGDVLDEKGKVVGYHDGALFFTIGERHGFNITQKTDREVPSYVVKKDIDKNTLTVTCQITPQTGLVQWSSLYFLSWVFGKMPNLNNKYSCRIRYRQEKIGCRIKKGGGKIKIIFDKPQRAVSTGQSLVLYDGEICLGGGIIS